MSEKTKSIPTDEDALRVEAVADLIDVQGPVLFPPESSPPSGAAYIQLHLRKGFDKDSFLVLGAEPDKLRQISKEILKRLDE